MPHPLPLDYSALVFFLKILAVPMKLKQRYMEFNPFTTGNFRTKVPRTPTVFKWRFLGTK